MTINEQAVRNAFTSLVNLIDEFAQDLTAEEYRQLLELLGEEIEERMLSALDDNLQGMEE